MSPSPGLTVKYGFSVVVPMSTMVPFSPQDTKGSIKKTGVVFQF